MKEKELYHELLSLCEKLGIEVRVDKSGMASSSCFLKGKKIFILNDLSTAKDRIDFLLAELKRDENIDMVFCPPAIRELLNGLTFDFE